MGEEIYLGDMVKDLVTGLQGIAAARCEHMNGCVQWELAPKRPEGHESDDCRIWVDERQLQVTESDPHGLRPPEPDDGPELPGLEREGEAARAHGPAGPHSRPPGMSHP